MKFIFVMIGITVGVLVGFLVQDGTSHGPLDKNIFMDSSSIKREVIGFLPFALLSRAQTDYASEITTLAYFGLTVNPDGTIAKLVTPQEEDPGWFALSSGKVDPFLQHAKKNKLTLSLVIYSGKSTTIDTLMEHPVVNATNLADDVLPLMDQYGFSNLNLDIESTKEASPAAQTHFVQFVQILKKRLTHAGGKTLTIDVSTVDLINDKTLIKPKEVAVLADSIVIMAYDYHSTVSFVTGPVAPLGGAGIESEYDVEAAVQKALELMPAEKIILGAPLYGYEWESQGAVPRSAVIPNTGQTASNRRSETLVAACATCSAQFDSVAQEAYLIYFDPSTQTYHQLFFPIEKSMSEKISLVQHNHLRGLALWALGYEGKTILRPLQAYLQ